MRPGFVSSAWKRYAHNGFESSVWPLIPFSGEKKLNTAIIINLDYETFSIVKCRKLWRLIEDEMADAGFYKSIRLFITPVDTEVAFARARDVLQNIERTFRDDGEDVLLCVREFYGIPYANVVDLALPSSQEITVDFMAAGTFQNLFPGHP